MSLFFLSNKNSRKMLCKTKSSFFKPSNPLLKLTLADRKELQILDWFWRRFSSYNRKRIDSFESKSLANEVDWRYVRTFKKTKFFIFKLHLYNLILHEYYRKDLSINFLTFRLILMNRIQSVKLGFKK